METHHFFLTVCNQNAHLVQLQSFVLKKLCDQRPELD